ncbi:MAG: [Fe-S]-binding protein [Planctomycetes bacterium]|nr:[Fe-S]-binding protein [Planctomycetota bacterium]
MKERTPNELLLPFEDSSGSRRSFLKLVGFGIGSASLAGCSRGPLQSAIPTLEASREFVPGRAYWIASTCGGCDAGCGVLAKCRDGRPIKLEGIPGHPVSGGGLCPAGQGSVLSLYDSQRFDGPQRGAGGAGSSVSWSDADRELRSAFDALKQSGGRVRLLTGTVNSPSTRAAIARFLAGFADARHISYDGLSSSAMLAAHERTHGERLLPRHHFERARTIASFDADFLSTWISPVEFTAGYTQLRELDMNALRMSKHFQLEARTSLTGCRADERVRLAPWEIGAALSGLCDHLEGRAGIERRCRGAADTAPYRELIARIADELWATRGESLVVAGANDVEIQVLVNYANELLQSYGTTLDTVHASQQRLGDDREVAELAQELAEDSVDLLIVNGVNPAYDFGALLPLERAGMLISCAGAPDETSALAAWVVPEPHFLEAWNDAEPYRGVHALSQPTVPLLRSGRTLRETLSRWAGDERADQDLLRAHWRAELYPRSPAHAGPSGFDAFFDQALHEGFVLLEGDSSTPGAFAMDAVRPYSSAQAPVAGALGLVLYPKAGMLDGRHGHNPWLHELPDPVSKIAWDNYACLSPTTAERLELSEGQLVSVVTTAEGASVELPVHVQRGQHDGVVAVALGYGRTGTDRFTNLGPEWLQGRPTVEAGGVIGANAALLTGPLDAGRRCDARQATVIATGSSVELASTQDHHSLTVPQHLAIEGHEVRDMVISTTFDDLEAHPDDVVHEHAVPHAGELWKEDHKGGTTWGMAIDLSRCTGCSGCVIGCQAENNVPVVGRDEVLRHREMSWLRIDRYYQGGDDELRTLHQPMMCQQCDHAPCESVCPVLATLHSDEGLNQQVYNRCVGTRYCANTCPYKVRRFNWFDYPREDKLQNHSLNPDVTVRTRGVMEKCSFCIQRIQEAKAEASREGRKLRDGDITPACQQSCPAKAIVFGNLEDPESAVARLAASQRSYSVLEELNVQPSVRYLAHVYNGPRTKGSHGH